MQDPPFAVFFFIFGVKIICKFFELSVVINNMNCAMRMTEWRFDWCSSSVFQEAFRQFVAQAQPYISCWKFQHASSFDEKQNAQKLPVLVDHEPDGCPNGRQIISILIGVGITDETSDSVYDSDIDGSFAAQYLATIQFWNIVHRLKHIDVIRWRWKWINEWNRHNLLRYYIFCEFINFIWI